MFVYYAQDFCIKMPTYTKKQQDKIIGDAIDAKKNIGKIQDEVSEINVNITSLVKDRIAHIKLKIIRGKSI